MVIIFVVLFSLCVSFVLTMAGDKSIDDCVLQSEVVGMIEEIKAIFKDHSNIMNHTLESINRQVSTLTERMDDFKKRLPVACDGDASVNNDDNNNRGGASDEEDDNDEQHAEREHAAQRDARLYDRLRCNQHGMGGNHNQQGNNENQNNDSFDKVKFIIPSFSGAYDADAYLDSEMTVEQKFNSHLVPEIHRVR
jgi:hypothetical protein